MIEVAVILEMLHLDSALPLLSREDVNSAAEKQQHCPAHGAPREHRAGLWFSLTASNNSVQPGVLLIWKFNLTPCQTDLRAALSLVSTPLTPHPRPSCGARRHSQSRRRGRAHSARCTQTPPSCKRLPSRPARCVTISWTCRRR